MLRYLGFGPPEKCVCCSGRGCDYCNGTGIQGNSGCIAILAVLYILVVCGTLAYFVLRK